jgi:hypothetical protein
MIARPQRTVGIRIPAGRLPGSRRAERFCEGLTMLSTGHKVTLPRIDDCLAKTHRYEFEVRQALEPKAVGHNGRKQRVAIVRQRRKRRVRNRSESMAKIAKLTAATDLQLA